MIIADILATRLYAAGCRHAFGIPGGEVLNIIEALDKSGILFHLVRHENSGGFMAEGTWHATGAPGILVATVGPGVLNAINVVANAWQDGVPLIYLTGCFSAAKIETYTHQVLDHRGVLSPVTKASFTLTLGAIETQIDKAILISISEKPGPVHIDIPVELSDLDEKLKSSNPMPFPQPMCPAPGPNLMAARKVFTEAKKPLIIAGLDVVNQKVEKTVAAVCKQFLIPLITTYKAKGVLSENDPLSLGGHGLSSLAFSILQPLLEKSDLIILCGYDPIEMRSEWVCPWPKKGVLVIEFSARANEHFAYKSDYCFIGNIGDGLDTLCEGAEQRPIWRKKEPEKARASLEKAFSNDEMWGPEAIITAAYETFPFNGVATVDTGAHRILLSQLWKCIFPRTLFQSTGLCTMGAALPIAIGYKLGKPDTPVLCFTGDGGLEMILGELATVRDLKLSIPIIVFVDNSLALIELKQRKDGKESLGVNFGCTDYVTAAIALGGRGLVVKSRKEIKDAITAAFACKTFTIIVCPIGRQAYDEKF